MSRAEAALDRFFDHYYHASPVQATFTGVHDHDARLPDWSPEGLEARTAAMRGLRCDLDDAGRVDDAAVGTYPDAADLALADGHLAIQLAEDESRHFIHRNPALWTGEAIFGAIALVTRPFAPIDVRLGALAARMHAVPGFLAAARRVLADVPVAWRERALRECAAGVTLFGESLPRWWRTAAMPELASRCDRAAAEARDACAGFAVWLRQDVTTTDASPPAGADLLGLLLGRGHWCPTPPAALLAEAREALDAECAALDRLARARSPLGWPGVRDQIAAARPTMEEYLPRIERIWQSCRDAAVAHGLVTWPDAPIRYVPIPEHTRTVAPALYYLFYRSPAPFDRLPVHEYVVTPIDETIAAADRERHLTAWNDAAIALNHVIHHGGLGHHVQNARAAACRSRVGRVAAVDGASRIGMFSGGTLAEGWACYACDLMDEAGVLGPLERVAQQHTRVRLAARAVSDLELHLGCRSFDGVASGYVDRAGMAGEAARGETLKNSMFPGAAVMYWLGTRGLHAMRRDAARREGQAFTLRRFHDRVLEYGAIPVPLIARLMGRAEAA